MKKNALVYLKWICLIQSLSKLGNLHRIIILPLTGAQYPVYCTPTLHMRINDIQMNHIIYLNSQIQINWVINPYMESQTMQLEDALTSLGISIKLQGAEDKTRP